MGERKTLIWEMKKKRLSARANTDLDRYIIVHSKKGDEPANHGKLYGMRGASRVIITNCGCKRLSIAKD